MTSPQSGWQKGDLMQFENSNRVPVPRRCLADVILPAVTLASGMLFTFAWIGLLTWIALRLLA